MVNAFATKLARMRVDTLKKSAYSQVGCKRWLGGPDRMQLTIPILWILPQYEREIDGMLNAIRIGGVFEFTVGYVIETDMYIASSIER